MHFDWLFQISWLFLTNQSALFQHSNATLKFVIDICSSGQSYKASTIVIYESIVVKMCNLLVTTTLEYAVHHHGPTLANFYALIKIHEREAGNGRILPSVMLDIKIRNNFFSRGRR